MSFQDKILFIGLSRPDLNWSQLSTAKKPNVNLGSISPTLWHKAQILRHIWHWSVSPTKMCSTLVVCTARKYAHLLRCAPVGSTYIYWCKSSRYNIDEIEQKFRAKHLYVKAARKMLVKLTPDRSWKGCAELWPYSSFAYHCKFFCWLHAPKTSQPH